jgi:hypothetical protein
MLDIGNGGRDILKVALMITAFLLIMSPVVLVTIRNIATRWLTKRLKALVDSGVNTKEARRYLKELNPLPWQIRFLYWLRKNKGEDYTLSHFLNRFTSEKSNRMKKIRAT